MSVSTNERPVVTTTAEMTPAMADDVSWIASAKDNVVSAVKTGWGWFTSAISWLVDKAVDAYEWTEDKIVRGSKWLWTKTKAGGRRSKRWAITAWNWSADHAVIAWNWMVNTAAWGWSYVGPALRWTSTPVRVGLGAIFGFAAVQTVGPAIFGVLAISYLTYVLVTGRFWFGSREKVFKGDYSAITKEQDSALAMLMVELEDSKKTTTTKIKRSELVGQIQLVNVRLQGGNATPGQVYREYKRTLEMNMSPEELRAISWTHVHTGIRIADARVQKLLAPVTTATATSALPQAALV